MYSSIKYPALPYNKTENAATALEVSTSPTTLDATPQRPLPNSGKRRQHTLSLSRLTPTPSHRIKIANIFQEAGVAFNARTSPSMQPAPNTKRTRRPFLPHRKSLSNGLDDEEAGPAETKSAPISQVFTTVPSTSGLWQEEAMSSGMNTPVAPSKTIPPRGFALPLFLEVDSESEETHSSHGVPLIIPLHGSSLSNSTKPRIDAWLDDVLGLTPEDPMFLDTSKAAAGTASPMKAWLPLKKPSPPFRSLKRLSIPHASAPLESPTSRVSSNKENVDPLRSPLSTVVVASPSSLESIDSPSKHLNITPTKPHRSRNFIKALSVTLPTAGIVSASRFNSPGTPRGFLAQAPKRKKLKPDISASSTLTEKMNTKVEAKSATIGIVRDNEGNGLPKLSPLVECHRKGRGPKRERCLSYFDEDILPELRQPLASVGGCDANIGGEEGKKGRRVLSGSEYRRTLTKQEALTEEAENAHFESAINREV
ncbi:hypothetical protein MMC06_003917 [Schaereria dolodes]|nr:hypothetical protein [Schaereria dolodes]